MLEKTTGRVHILQDNVDTDQILPGYAMSLPEEELVNHVLRGSIINDFPEKVNKGDVIVGGSNFGCGSSREQAPLALKNAGVSAIIAKSFARIFRRNAINIGLPVITGDIIGKVKAGDEIELDIVNQLIINKENNSKIELDKLAESTLETLKADGLINKVRNILIERGEI